MCVVTYTLLGLLSLTRVLSLLVHLAVLSFGILFVLLIANNLVYKVLFTFFACYSTRIEISRILNYRTDLHEQELDLA